MALTLLIAFLLGIFNVFIVRVIISRSLNKSNNAFLLSFGSAFFYKLTFLTACFIVFYKLKLPHMIWFFIALIVTQTVGQILFSPKKK